jgi:CheY-like chemotaxis protein
MSTPVPALLVEDDPLLIDLYARALTSAEYSVTTASDGQQALDHLAANTPYLVILDLHLPIRSGEEVLRYIRATPHLQETKVIIASADAALANWLDKQADFVLNKPVTYSQLRALTARLK